jgi:hypothetical protein
LCCCNAAVVRKKLQAIQWYDLCARILRIDGVVGSGA